MSADRFAAALTFVLRWEGGYSNHPADKGGPTNQGITERTYNTWRVGRGQLARSIAEIEPAEVHEIYRERYWQPMQCDDMVDPLDLVLFDSAVQHGPARAAKWLQSELGVVIDGRVGPVTLAAVNRRIIRDAGVAELVADYLHRRQGFYLDLIDRDPTQVVFARGWSNRMRDLQTTVMV